MKIAVSLGVKDEIELIGASIAHLRAIGVDHIIACDANSTDGTRQVLDRIALHPWLDLLTIDDTDPQAELGLDDRIANCARAAGADWLMFLDADEFPLPRTGRMADVAALAGSVPVEVARFNVPLGPLGPAMPALGAKIMAAEVLLYVPPEGRNAAQGKVRADPMAPWVQSIPSPKVLVPLSQGFMIAEGGHSVLDSDLQRMELPFAHDLVIAHLPFTTSARFARKVDNMRRLVGLLGHHWGPASAWHWRRWLDNIDQRGGVDAEISRNRISGDEMSDLRQSGLIRVAAELLAGNDP